MRSHDTLVLRLLWQEARGGLKAWSWREAFWILLGGGGLLAYGTFDALEALQKHAAMLRAQNWVWSIGVPSAALASGIGIGLLVGKISTSRGYAPFLGALPISVTARRRMVGLATLSLGLPAAMIMAAVVAVVSIVVGWPGLSGLAFALVTMVAASFGVGVIALLHVLGRLDPASDELPDAPGSPPGPRLAVLEFADTRGTAWLGSWAWESAGRRLRVTWSRLAWTVVIGFGLALGAAVSLARHSAQPAAVAGLVGGLLCFMLALRYRPLGSPALRSLPIGFVHAWARLLRLPLLLSIAVFLLPAAAATAAEPSAWLTPVNDGAGMLLLDGIYSVFAAYFIFSPLTASMAFVGTLAYAVYISFQYGNSVYLGVAGLLAFLWHRARARYRHG